MTTETEDRLDPKHNFDGRYEFVHPDTGLVVCCRSLGDAFAWADRIADARTPTGEPKWSDPWAFEVYDRMARVGQPRTWKRQPKNPGPGGRCWQHGDRYSMGAWWVMVERRT